MSMIYKKTFYDKCYNNKGSIEIAKGHNPSFSIHFDEAGDYPISIILSCYFFIAISVNVSSKKFWNFLRYIFKDKYIDRELRLAFHDGGVWWNVFTNDDLGRNVPKYRDGNFNFINAIRGHYTCTKIINEERDYNLPMPEGSYKCLVQKFTSHWNYPRFNYFFKKASIRYNCMLGYIVNERPENPKDINYFREKGQLEWQYDERLLIDGKEFEYFISKPMEDVSKPKWNDSSTSSITGYHKAKSLNEAASLFLADLFKGRLMYFGDNHIPNSENK